MNAKVNGWWVKEEGDGYSLTSKKEDATNFLFRFLFFPKKIFEKSIQESRKCNRVEWVK